MKNLKNKALLLPVTAGLLLALAGCGGAQEAPTTGQGPEPAATEAAPAPVETLAVPAAQDIYPKVSETIRDATSVAIDGNLTSGSETAKVKLSGKRDGSNALAEMTRKGASFTVLTADGGSYVKADKEFLTQNMGKEAAQVVDSLAGSKWISVKDPSKFGDISVASLLDTFGADDLKATGLGKITDESVVDLNGAKAFKYTAEEGIIWIAAEGEPYLLQLEPTDPTGKDSGTLAFTDWNAVKPHTAPAKDETVSVPGL